MSRPLFSVVICTYNRPQLLKRAIESALNQTLSDFEVVVVDDHSLEPVDRVVERFQDHRLHLFRQRENRGVASSTNLAVTAARGEYVCILNDDDCLLPDFLTRMAAHLKSTRSDFAWCGIQDSEEERPEGYGLVFKQTHHQDPWATEELLTRVGLGFGFTIRKEVLESVGGLDENLRSSEDTELFLRLVQHPLSWQSLPDCLVRVYRQKERLTRPSPRRIQDLVYMMEKHRSFFESHPGLRGHFRLVLASLYVESGQRAKGRRALWELLMTHPGQLRVWALLLANELGLGSRLLETYRRVRAWLSRR